MEIALEQEPLTTVILGGSMGKQFGKKWQLALNSVHEAFQLLEANEPGFINWIRNNADKYDRYHIKVTKRNGSIEEIDETNILMQSDHNSIKEIRITPIIAGAGAVFRIALGVVALVVSYFFPVVAPYLAPIGVSLIIGGIVELLSPTPKLSNGSSREDKTSYYFDGPVNTVNQGVPVTLIFGKEVLVGSQAISAKVTIDQLM